VLPRKPPTPFQRKVQRVINLIFLSMAVLFIGWRVKLHWDVGSLRAAYRAAGLPTTGEELNAFYAAVPDEDNAALPIMQAVELMQEYPDDRRFEIRGFDMPGRTEGLSSEQEMLLRGYVALNTNALLQLMTAQTLPRSRYPVDLSGGLASDTTHLGQVKSLGKLLEYHALLALLDHRSDDAVQSIQSILCLARSLDAEPTLLASLVRDALVSMAVRSTERALTAAPLDAPSLAEIHGCLRSVRRTNSFMHVLAGETGSVALCLALEHPEMFETKKTDDNTPPPVGKVGWAFVRLSGLYARDLRFYLRGMQTNLAVARRPLPDRLAMTNQFAVMQATAEARHHFIVSLLLPVMGKVVLKDASGVAVWTLGQAGLAIEEFRTSEGRLPNTLEELVPAHLNSVPIDPLDGQPLRYLRRDQGYVLYSIGSDQQDDGGRERPGRIKSSDTNSYDLTFIVER
jgi:hypothetical protein